MSSLKASTQGLKLIDQARCRKGWNKTASAWLNDADKISRATLNRFWQRQPIKLENFIAICKAVDIPWEDVVDSNDNTETPPSSLPGKTYIPTSRCHAFWGRDPLIKQILDTLNNPEELYILSLSGSAGYGKTEIACQTARLAFEQHLFSHILWVTARNTQLIDGRISQTENPTSLDWKQFLSQLAHQISCPTEQVQQRLKTEKFLIILDNAETANVEEILSQLHPMLQPSRAILTSRLKTKPPYVKLIPISGLAEPDSRQLLYHEAEYNHIPALLNASDEQLHQIYTLSCGAPLGLHFIVGRVLDDCSLTPVLSELQQARGQVEEFYTFCLNTAWQRISQTSQSILRYLGQMDAGVTQDEIIGAWNTTDTDFNASSIELKRWYLLENQQDAQGQIRYNLHPWVRSSVRSGLVDKWQPSLEDWEQVAKYKYGIDLGSIN